MTASDLDKELGQLIRRAINDGMESIIVLGFLSQNAVEVALHSRKCAEVRMQQTIKNSIRKTFEGPAADGAAPNPAGN
jgi:hypothetical protein